MREGAAAMTRCFMGRLLLVRRGRVKVGEENVALASIAAIKAEAAGVVLGMQRVERA